MNYITNGESVLHSKHTAKNFLMCPLANIISSYLPRCHLDKLCFYVLQSLFTNYLRTQRCPKLEHVRQQIMLIELKSRRVNSIDLSSRMKAVIGSTCICSDKWWPLYIVLKVRLHSILIKELSALRLEIELAYKYPAGKIWFIYVLTSEIFKILVYIHRWTIDISRLVAATMNSRISLCCKDISE